MRLLVTPHSFFSKDYDFQDPKNPARAIKGTNFTLFCHTELTDKEIGISVTPELFAMKDKIQMYKLYEADFTLKKAFTGNSVFKLTLISLTQVK